MPWLAPRAWGIWPLPEALVELLRGVGGVLEFALLRLWPIRICTGCYRNLRRVDGFAQALVFMFEGLGFRASAIRVWGVGIGRTNGRELIEGPA